MKYIYILICIEKAFKKGEHFPLESMPACHKPICQVFFQKNALKILVVKGIFNGAHRVQFPISSVSWWQICEQATCIE